MKVLRTPDERFIDLPGYKFSPCYAQVKDDNYGAIRVHYIDEGLRDAPPVLMMHGEPTWSYLYRKMIPIVASAGYRVVVPDLVGFGRSDKLAQRSDYTYKRHVDWLQDVLEQLSLNDITLVGQDWGGLIGLRLLSAEPGRFSRVVVANTWLPTGDGDVTEAFRKWRKYSQEALEFPIGQIVSGGCVKPLPADVVAAYDAPFPDDTYKEGARIFPSLVPITPDDPAAPDNKKAWEVLKSFNKPFLTAFSDSDPVTRGGDKLFKKLVPGTQGMPHATITGGGHFLQEDCGEEFAKVIVEFIKKT